MISMPATQFIRRVANELKREICGGSTSVLVVDDDEGCVKAFKAIFHQPSLAGCDVEFADSVNQGMALVVSRCFDFAILDYKLPDGTAGDLVRQWQEHGYELPFVVITGHGANEERKEMQALGALAFMEKSDDMNSAAVSRLLYSSLNTYWRSRSHRQAEMAHA